MTDYPIVEKAVGTTRSEKSYAWREIINYTIPGWHNNQKLTAYEALKAFTLGSSYMNFEETKKGSILKGKLGDFVVAFRRYYKI